MSPPKTATTTKIDECADSSGMPGLLPERAEKVSSQLAYLVRVLKTPTIGRAWEDLADQVPTENCAHERVFGRCPAAAGR